ncbi:MAG: TRAP transporter small permease subunit [Alphaproteobacteria bacterium]|nr:TRAP transporter small permease subunit [Alphaproteobacteria bacterium]
MLGSTLRFIDRLSALAMRAAVALGAALFAVMLLEVFMRYALGRPLIWSQEVTGMLNACMFLAAAAPALRAGAHVTVDALAEKLPARVQAAILAVALALLFLPAIALIEWTVIGRAWRAFLTAEVDEVSPWRHVLWPYYAAIALALLPFVLQVAAEAARHAAVAVGGRR